MKREIKFRAYNKKTKQMCDVLLICFVNRYVNVLPEENLEGGNQETWSFDDIEVMQFTGLYDRNKNPIYEGDILRIKAYKIPLVVQWDYDQWGLFDTICNEASIDEKYDEIIGNVYKNAELLRDKP